MATTRRGTETGDIPADIREALEVYAGRTGIFANNVHWFAETGSTNDVALRLAERGAVEGSLIGADAQTAGRGRLGRTWSSPPGAGLYVSVILRPPAEACPLVTITAGVAIAEGLRTATGLTTALKWPNDLYVGLRKVAGILAEAGASPGGLSHVVLGFGINLMPAAYPPDVAARAASLESELGRPVDRGVTLAACLAALSRRYDDLVQRRTSSLLDEWRTLAGPTLHRRVECVASTGRVIGIAEDIDEAGALLVRTDDGIVRVISGEVTWS